MIELQYISHFIASYCCKISVVELEGIEWKRLWSIPKYCPGINLEGKRKNRRGFLSG
jgi:hypothetical protein